MSGLKLIVFSLVAAVAALLVYSPSLHSGFFWDDDSFIVQNPQMHSLRGLAQIWCEPASSPHYYPLLLTVFWLLEKLFADSAAGYHFVNIALHVGNAIMLCLLGARLGIRFAWAAALIFLLHPINVQSVAWITEMKNTLSTLFILLGCFFWVGARNDPAPAIAGARWWAVGILFAAAMLTKSTSLIMLPALVLIDLVLGRPLGRRNYWFALLPFFVGGLAFALFSVSFERSVAGDGPIPLPGWWERVGLAAWSVFFYFSKLAWPVSLAPVYATPKIDAGWIAFWTTCLVLVVAAAVYWGSRHSWRPFASLALYCAFLLPIPFIGIGFTRWYGPVTDHFAYVPSIVFSLVAVGVGASHANKRTHLLTLVFLGAALCLLLGLLTFRHAEKWRVGSVWEAAALNAPQSLAGLNYAKHLIDNGQIQDASMLLARLADKLGATPPFVEAYSSVLAMQGRHSEAEQILRSALRGNPRDTRIWRALGTLLVNSGRPEQAIAPLSETLAANPANRIALASALVRAGRLNEARGQAGLLSAPTRSTFELLTDLAADFSTVGEFDEAERLLSSILGRFPLAHRARLGLAYVLLDAGKIDEAHAQFSQIVLFLPDNAAAIAGMAECLQKQGRSDKAAALFEDVLSRLAIDDIHNSYAWFLATCADPDYRNPVKAMAQLREIQPALLETNSYYQGTLAATFAAQGDYSAAVVAAEKSIRLAESAGDRALAENTRERLALYRQGRPYINSTAQSP